ncbi:type VI secretion system Vgr family protein [Burkholderia pseudomultivorans]|uniref:Actin cross-linking toxin VgrG1 n=1 Tax=Burkholderia pseudomultivorans TaxID=1207504 RepID=A0A6P2JGJ0_9BURK|nr:type VI secretion system Vgr family protein [Burkholderia pseudomultivorans]MDR8726388.1 Actin cross-linking toxin VgrG1 [Burkholderia pseudomultivorans]MDR8733612.1 Actin cross-linking toxin VgrG1 [Burkholderia pseudomultivorans]MDR8740138.1 Actin cross-linking toxin VgrG1 [Burkholderia pseudomultivorans]MDR8752194.1 Actin cross-linking toxin VgrG1 [Burkholderia pseudomultivorans]MDR8776589.1 Actin cross-linking toxin VgrG1 [Burkholderia pseudomultivorans]
MDVSSQLSSLADLFSAADRLYSLEGQGPLAGLQVESWSGREHLSENYRWDVYGLSRDPALDLDDMLGQRVTLRCALTNGSLAVRSGLVVEACCLGFDGMVARYSLQLAPWLAVLDHGRTQRTFVKQSLADILGMIFGEYEQIARWRFTVDADKRIEALGLLDYKIQYRTQTHFGFVRQLLADAGLGFCFVEDDDAPAGHTLVIFDDSAQLPEDETSARLAGIPRRLSDGDTVAADQILGIGQSLSLMADRLTLISSDYRGNQATTASASLGNPSGARELYDDVGPEAFESVQHAEDTARRQADAIVSRARFWMGCSTLRSARSGNAFRIANPAWQLGRDNASVPDEFLLVAIEHAGVNNLPKNVIALVERGLGMPPPASSDSRISAHAAASGYANRFEAVPRRQAWRPTLEDGSGQRLNPVPTALGAQTARVAGPQGELEPAASSPVHTDAQGRIRIRFHWQLDSDYGTYPTRGMQRLASDGHGLQQTPRIGQEVLVQFQHGLLHRPIVLGGLFNGRGEGGEAPTPGGEPASPLDPAVYRQASDHAPSVQGNLAGGYSPSWHGAGGGADGHNHVGVLSGFKSQGFDGQGCNQLVADDSDAMGRLQMATTHAATELNLGHLRHQADNYLGSFRGQGVELRTDAYGAVRGARGVLVSSYATMPDQPAGDVSALQSLLAQQATLARLFDQAAETHRTMPLAVQRGVQRTGQSMLDDHSGPIDALTNTFSTTVSAASFDQAASDARQRDSGQPLPHTGDAVLGLEAQGGQGIFAGQALHWAAGETLTVGSGEDINMAVNQIVRMHSGQGIGWLAAAREASGAGLSVISGASGFDLQAQHDRMTLHAQKELKMVSVNANVELAASKTLHLAVSGGAHLTIEGGNVVFGCPGSLTVHAAKHGFVGPDQLDTQLPQFADKVCVECLMHAMQSGSALAGKSI